MNVLLTSVGRRGYLVEYFRDAVKPCGNVIAANSETLTSGMIAADKAYHVPQVDSDDYIPAILDICHNENVGLVVSLFDIDLPYLAKARNQFIEAGIELAVSDPWVIDIANDKWKTWEFLTANGIASPRTFLDIISVRSSIRSATLSYPLIIKPRWGMGSLSVFRADNEEELEFFYSYARRQIEKSYLNILSGDQLEHSIVVQEFVAGNEYGLDVFNDLSGGHLQTISKQKLAMRSGETDMAKVIDDPKLTILGEKLASLLKHRGNIDVDVLENEDGELFVLEMNARFGGGYPFSHLAGADFPLALVDMAVGISPRGINNPKPGVIGLKSIDMIQAQS